MNARAIQPKGYVRNCLLIRRDTDESPYLFHADGDVCTPALDGYAIIPVEEYQRLLLGYSLPKNPPASSAKTYDIFDLSHEIILPHLGHSALFLCIVTFSNVATSSIKIGDGNFVSQLPQRMWALLISCGLLASSVMRNLAGGIGFLWPQFTPKTRPSMEGAL